LRLLKSEERKLYEVRNVLVVGEENVWVEHFNAEAHLKSLHNKITVPQ
jgi:hypothetical protein